MRVTNSVLIAATIVIVAGARAGDLSPPSGAIQSTMKTLTEVEPRTPIHAADLPLTISSPGSYYLAESITATGDGITIFSDDVTVDLMGFTLTGGTGAGISMIVPHKNITIKNGIVRGWATSGISGPGATNSHFQNLVVADNGTTTAHRGLVASDACVVKDCTAVGNTGDGIKMSQAATITGCVARDNGGSGIRLASGSVTRCTSRNNNSIGINGTGATVVDGCMASGSTTAEGIKAGTGSVVRNCSALSNARDGINISFGEVRDCTCYNNDGDGIQANFNSMVIGNNCSSNTLAGINVAGRRSRIEGNTVHQNATGIGGTGIKNLIIRNSAARNSTANYGLAADNAVGEIVDVTGTAGVPFTSGSPWANFVFEPVP